MCEKTNDIDIGDSDDFSYEGLFSEEFYAVQDDANLPMYIINPKNYEVLYCNNIFKKYIKRDPVGELCYKSIRERETPCESCTAMRLYLNGDRTPKEFSYNGNIWTLLQASPMTIKGHDLIQITCIDITKQKNLENQLILKNKEYDAVVRQSVTSVLRYDIADDVAAVNVDMNLKRTEEYTIPNYIDTVLKNNLITPESIAEAKAVLSDILSGYKSRGYDIKLCLEGERFCWIHVDYVLINDSNGKAHRAVLFFFDNTEQREKELAYKHWNDRLNAFMNEYTLYLDVNLTQDLIEAEGRLGLWRQETEIRKFTDHVEEIVRTKIHLEDKEAFINFFDREHLLGQFYAGRKESSIEYRVMDLNTPIWHRAEIQLILSPHSEDVRMAIVIENVNEHKRLENEAERDIMTGLYNHSTSEELIGKLLADKDGESCCFIIIDLDDLRNINSSMGHPEGDRALKAIARIMQSEFGSDDILGRIGGDEFVVMMRFAPDKETITRKMSNFIKTVNGVKIGPDDDYSIHVSAGGAMGVAGCNSSTELYKKADMALYYSKAMGKNAFNMYTPELEKIDFSYQPIIDATLTKLGIEGYNSPDFKKVIKGMSIFFSLVICTNITRNTFSVLEYNSFPTKHPYDIGSFDNLILIGSKSYHPDDRERLIDTYSRSNMLKAYNEGKTVLKFSGRQRGDDGVYRIVNTAAVLMKDEETGDIYEVSFSNVEEIQ